MEARSRWRQVGWALPWLLFLAFPVADLIITPRPIAARVVATVALLAFTGVYLDVILRSFAGPGTARRGELLAIGVLGAGLAVWLGPGASGLLIYVATAAAAALPDRWMWPVVGAAAAVCTAVLAASGLLAELFFLPVLCGLSAFALRSTRYLISVNAELVEARHELARSAVAEERMRFARDLHDLLGHSLSLIALKSELAGRLAERDPARARQEMADVETAARQALAEVREAVSGYRQVTAAQAVEEARAALSAAGITLHAPARVPPLPESVDGVLGWVLREATTNVLRHSAAGTVTITLDAADDCWTLEVADDGRGGDRPRGAGLRGVAERLAAIGGRLETSGAVEGFRLRAVVPVPTPVQQVGAP